MPHRPVIFKGHISQRGWRMLLIVLTLAMIGMLLFHTQPADEAYARYGRQDQIEFQVTIAGTIP